MRLERTTSGSGGQRSIQLSYGDKNDYRSIIQNQPASQDDIQFCAVLQLFSGFRVTSISLPGTNYLEAVYGLRA